MESRVVIRGPEGHVRWAYHKAASLRSWVVQVEPSKSTLTATVVSTDAFAVSQSPLTFVVPRPKGQPWRWPIISLQIADTSLTATLGPQE